MSPVPFSARSAITEEALEAALAEEEEEELTELRDFSSEWPRPPGIVAKKFTWPSRAVH
jgi:hypothetical protein